MLPPARIDPYSENNPSFRKAYIRERLAANRAERESLVAERNRINELLQPEPAKVPDRRTLETGPFAPPTGPTAEPIEAPDLETPPLPPKVERLEPQEPAAGHATIPMPEPIQGATKSRAKKKAAMWKRKRPSS